MIDDEPATRSFGLKPPIVQMMAKARVSSECRIKAGEAKNRNRIVVSMDSQQTPPLPKRLFAMATTPTRKIVEKTKAIMMIGMILPVFLDVVERSDRGGSEMGGPTP